MKKILMALLLFAATSFSAFALCISRTFVAYDDGEYFGKLVLYGDCRVKLSTVDGENFDGTYYIDTDGGLEQGRQYSIVFNFSNGQKIYATYGYPVYGKQNVLLDGFLFEAK